ncbi:MAG: hypothetical protein WCK80_02805 [bacterium]
MEFPSRNTQAQPTPVGVGPTGPKRKSRKFKDSSLVQRILILIAVIAVAIVLIAGILSLIGTQNGGEKKYVDSTKLQAVFLNTGQVYFGNIKTLNNKYIVLTNIYYLQTANNNSGTASTASPNVTLVKLGCELHEPYDQMLINRDQVTFWENLQDNGQVAKAVSTFVKQNPNGQKCADQSNSSSNTSNNVQKAGQNGSTNP